MKYQWRIVDVSGRHGDRPDTMDLECRIYEEEEQGWEVFQIEGLDLLYLRKPR